MNLSHARALALHATAYTLCLCGAAGGATLMVSYLSSGRSIETYFGGGLLGAALGLGISMVPVTCAMRYLEIKGFLGCGPDENRSSSSSELSDRVDS